MLKNCGNLLIIYVDKFPLKIVKIILFTKMNTWYVAVHFRKKK